MKIASVAAERRPRQAMSFRRGRHWTISGLRTLAVMLCCLGGPQVRGDPVSRAPNIVLILADDLGFADLGCYGSEIQTPTLDRLAANGLRFTQFYNTARCWPTRACLMSGYYAQQIRMDPPQGRLPDWASLLPHRLKPLGYRSYHSGKWHVRAAPRPVADGGFEHSYWFEDWDRYFSPAKHYVDDEQAPPVSPDSGYYATTAFTDRAIGFLQDHAAHCAGEPFFLYLAFIAPHFPLQALEEDIAPVRDRYLAGWDTIRDQRYQRQRELGVVDCALSPPEPGFTPRYFKPEVLDTLGPGEIPHAIPWSDLTAQQKRFQATKMAIHAAMITRMDREIGRLVAKLQQMDVLNNTLLLFLSDNGTDATVMVRGEGHDPAARPGSWRSFLCLGPGWSTVGNTPFRRHKIWVHEGGIATPLIVHWPAGITDRGQWRHDVGHVIDVVPTVLEAAGAKSDATSAGSGPPLPGRSLIPTLARDGALNRDGLYFNHQGNRALRVGDWKVVSAREDGDAWELYDLRNDRSEMHNLAAQEPDRVQAMVARWESLTNEFQKQAGSP